MRIILILLISFTSIWNVRSQHDFEQKGYSIYQKYDQSFVTPFLRGKHSVSIGGVASIYGPSMFSLNGNIGAHLGYNYLVIGERKLKLSKKGKTRDEVRFGLGLHCYLQRQGEFSLMGTVYRPLIKTKGRIFSWYLLSEYGLGYHKTINLPFDDKPYKIDLSVELFRLRFGKLPMYVHLTGNYALSNDFLSKERLNVGFIGGLRYYIYKNKL